MLNNFIMFYELEIRVHGHFFSLVVVVVILSLDSRKNLVVGHLRFESIGQNE